MTLTKNELEQIITEYKNILNLKLRTEEILKCKQSNNEFTLKDIIERRNQPYWKNFLEKLDSVIVPTKKFFKSIRKLRKKINQTPFSTLWELDLISWFESKKILLETEVTTQDNSDVDLQVRLAGLPVLVEAYVKRLDEENGYVNISSDLAEIVREKREQNNIPSALTISWILAINGEYAGIDPNFIKIGLTPSSFFDEPLLSGILLKHVKIIFIANPKARNPLSDKQINELLECGKNV